MIRRITILALLGLGFAILLLGRSGIGQTSSVALLTIKGPIGPAVSDYVRRGLDKAVERGAVAVVLQIDTPGGLDTSMREIIQDILASPIPVIGYVSPSGARAASAGTYILYAAHVAAMAPATNVGAATPVQIGGGSPLSPGSGDKDDEAKDKTDKTDKTDKGDRAEDAEPASEEEAADGGEETAPKSPAAKPGLPEKAMNDAIAYIRSLAQKRGRNAEWAVKAVSEAASLSAEDALAQGVIDLIADNVEDLLAKAHGRIVDVAGTERPLKTAELAIVEIEPDWRNELLAVVTNPTVAYLLLTLGIQAILLEFYTGTLVAGVVGAICLILGLYGLHVLPINFAGLGLILFGLALLAGEVFLPSFGILGIGGIVAFVAGSIMLIDTDVPGLGISPYLIGSIAAVAGGLMLLTATMILRLRRRPVVSGVEEMVDSTGKVVEWSGEAGQVRVHGEIWQARAGQPLEPGSGVRITAIDGLTVVVEPETKGS